MFAKTFLRTPYKKQKTTSSYKILPLNGPMTVSG